MARFLADQTCLYSRANFSGMAHRISTKIKLPIPDLGRYTQSVLFITGDVDKSKIFLTISGSL